MRNKIIFLSVIISILLVSCERAYNIEEYIQSKQKIVSINKQDWLYSEDGAYYYTHIAINKSEVGEVAFIYVELPGDTGYKMMPLEFSQDKNDIHNRFLLNYFTPVSEEKERVTIRVNQIDNNVKVRPPSMKFKIITQLKLHY